MYNPPIGDFVTSSLSGVLAAGASSATIGTGLNIPANDGVLEISYDTANAIGATDGPETISYTSYTTGTGALAGLTRGLAGTTDVQHSSGQSVQSAVSSLHFSTDPSWANLNYTCVYASATTFTVAGVDLTGLLSVGDKIKFTQTTAKYFYVTAVVFSTNTTVTVTGGTDYTIANAAITSPYYSKMVSPVGFPQWFAHAAPTFTVGNYDDGAGGQPTTSEYRFAINGRTCVAHYRGNGTKAGADPFIIFSKASLPVTPINYTDRTCLGTAYQTGAANELMTVFTLSTDIYCAANGNMADNAVISSFTFNLSYEI